jgi:peptide/nickel transport system permease protein
MRLQTKVGLLLALVIGLHLIVLTAGFVAPYDPTTQFRDYPFAPPMRVHFFDDAGHFHFRPLVYGWQGTGDAGEYREDHACPVQLQFFVRGDSYTLFRVFHSDLHLFSVTEPDRFFLLGTDSLGRDQFSRLLYGGQISLFSGLIAAGLALLIGLLLGAAAGYHGGAVDALLMRTTEAFAALPWIYLLIAVRAFLPLRMDPGKTFLLVIAVIGILGWTRPARLVRGVVLSAKERNFVLAARGFGAGEVYLLGRHVLPQARGVMLTQAAILIPQYILAEVTLSFLGLGVAEPVPSWGNMLSALQQYNVLASYWWMVIPGLVLIPVFLAYYVLARSLEQPIQSVRP